MRNRTTFLIVCCFVLQIGAVVSICAAPTNVLDYRPFPSSWQAQLDKLVNNGDIPGAAVVVKSPEWGVRVGVTGKADIENDIPPAPDMHFRIGSVTKVFTAMVILHMEQEGLLRLDDTVDQYLTGDRALEHTPDLITIRDCLQMTSGLADYMGDQTILASPDTNPLREWTPKELLNAINSLTPFFTPGATLPNPYQVQFFGVSADEAPRIPHWWYTNSGYTLLGMIIEEITGNKLEDVIKTRITDKIGLGNTFFATDEEFPPNMMHGYTHYNAQQSERVHDDWHDMTVLNVSYAWSAGAVVSTPWDLLRFAEAIFKEESIINEGTRQKWYRFESADIRWFHLDYGVGGLMQSHRPYGDCRGHGGAIPSYHTLMYHFYDTDTFIIIAVNTWDGGYEVTILDDVMPLVLNVPHVVSPQDDGMGIEMGNDNSVVLDWQAGPVYGDTYEVYLGTTADDVNTASSSSGNVVHHSVSTTDYTAMNLEPETTYFWRVDTVADEKTIQGPVWAFTTAPTGPSKVEQWKEHN